MKKPQNNFVVEYKGARRKPAAQPSSIWGNVDLRQFAGHDDAAENMPLSSSKRLENAECPTPEAEMPPALALTSAFQQPTTPYVAPEGNMADETSVTENTTTEAEVAAPKAAEPKKRGPRAKKAAAETAAAEATAEAPAAPKTRAKRGSKKAAVEAKPATRGPGRKAKAVVEAAAEAPAPAVSPLPVTASDEMEDLLQLEQENQRLRKLLAEKLRAENADLRKRLGQH